MGRNLCILRVPTGPAVLDLLPDLQRALTGQGPALLPVPAGDGAESSRLATGMAAQTPLAAAEDDPADPTAVVIATSGSTGRPKGALLSAGALRASGTATMARLAAGDAPSWLLALPAHHIAGLQVLLRSAANGTAPLVMDVAKPFTAPAFSAAVGRLATGQRLTSLVPTQLHRLLDDPEATAALATFRAVLVGGAATSGPLLARAAAAGVKVVTTYGMSETCGGCVYDGVPLDGVAVQIDEGTGRVCLAGAVIARGYRGLPGHPAFGPGVFRTDDLGAIGPDGSLIVTGRLDDIIVTGGVKIDPGTLEAALAAHPGIAEILVVGIPDAHWGHALVAVVVPGPWPARPDLRAVQEHAKRVAGPAAAPKHLVLVPQLPLRGPGKPDRSAAAELAARSVGAERRTVEASSADQ